MIRPAFLKTALRHAPRLADLHGAEWGHLYADWDAGAALREFEAQSGDGTLPATIVALQDDAPLGSVSLIYDDLPGYEHFNPWLASLFVLPEYRSAGVGRFLLCEAENVLRQNVLGQVYLFTESAGPFFRKSGWEFVETGRCNGHPVEILTKEISEMGGRSSV